MQGIDVSIHQGHIDWPAVAAAGYRFALCKASEGVGWTDQLFWRNWADIRRAGLFRGAYHFARPGLGNLPSAEADWFVQQVHETGDLLPGDVLALDLEDNGVAVQEDLAGWALAWLEAVERTTGRRPLLYSYPAYLEQHGLMAAPALARFPLWLASWRRTPPLAPPPWRSIAIWQYTSRGEVPGITGFVDLNVCLDPSIWQAVGGSPAGGTGEAPAGCSPADWEIVTTVRQLGGDAASVRGWIEQLGAQELVIARQDALLADVRATLEAELARRSIRRRVVQALLARLEAAAGGDAGAPPVAPEG